MLKTIDFSKKHFECGGRKFTRQDTIGLARYQVLQKLALEFGFSATFIDTYKNLRILLDNLNAVKFVESAVLVWNMLYGITQLEEKYPAAMRICALFIDEDGEDASIYDEGKMNDKIECWGRELAIFPFLNLAGNLVETWIDAYRYVSQSGLPKPEKSELLQ